MRHIPITLYIDTEFFKRQGLRFDTKAFKALTATFAKGGLRLLVPTIMERELLRHFSREAVTAANAVIKAHKEYPVNNLALAELPSLEKLKTDCIEEMNRQWSSFKEHFVVENLPITGNLEDVVDWYFEVRPPFSAKKPKEFPDALIISALDQHHELHHANIAVVGFDGDFRQACESRRYIMYFPDLEKYIEAFQPELSGEERLPVDVDPTKPIATEDLTELKAILARGSQVTPIEIERVMQLLKSRGTNYEYFFKNASDPIWISYIADKGFFLSPPAVEKTASGNSVVPEWPPIDYLIRVFDDAPKKVIEAVLTIPTTDNFRVLRGILRILLLANSPKLFKKLSHHVFAYIENYVIGDDLLIELLRKTFFFDSSLSDITPGLLLKLVEFQTESNKGTELGDKHEDSIEWTTQFDAQPRFNRHEYQEILEKGVCPLAEAEPYQVARILLDATASMIRLSTHRDELESGRDENHSEIWCGQLGGIGNPYSQPREVLVRTLVYACEQVYEKAPQSIEALDQTLKNQRWKIFKRIRQYLYSLHPNKQTLPWIREFILGHEDYAKWDHHYEFQLMIRKACKHFGSSLLSESEQKAIFDAILSGPSKESYREFLGDQYSEAAFQKRQRNFHRKQLHPFAPLLSGEYRDYYDELEKEFSAKPLSDTDYMPFKVSHGGFVQHKSPKTLEDLKTLSDKELLRYINEWDDAHHEKDNWLIEITISALASAFQSLFKEVIIPDDERWLFWNKQREEIKKPVYIASMVKAMQEVVKEKRFERLHKWLEFCAWVLTHPDTERKKGEPNVSDESCEHPDWGSSRRAVVDFIETCVEEEVNAPVTARDGIASILEKLCVQFDRRLDGDQPVILNQDDPLTEAINNTRSRAVQSLIDFGLWIRRHLPEDSVSEVTRTLELRLGDSAEFKLTRPEFAILGMHFTILCGLDREWASDNREKVFPMENFPFWQAAFSNYLVFNQPATLVFDILRGDFQFALEHFKDLSEETGVGENPVDRFGQHLFTYYLWEIYPLKGEESLLDLFFKKSDKKRQHWANLFDYIGRSLKRSNRNLDNGLIERIKAFFEWRLEAGEQIELKEFTYWLDAECLEPEWRLDALSRILDLKIFSDIGIYHNIKTIESMLQGHLSQVVDCFAKMTDLIDEEKSRYVPFEETKSILQAGLNSEDSDIRNNAKRARESLLKAGRFDFLELD